MSAARLPLAVRHGITLWAVTVWVLLGFGMVYVVATVFVGIEMYSATEQPMSASNR